MSQKKPGIYIPTLYFAEGLPYTIVMMMSAVYFKSLGASNVFIGLTTLLSLPWSLKFLWAPLVDFKGTKRRWILISQAALSVLCAVLAAGVYAHVPDVIGFSIIMLAAMALGSATHDISIDGYYLDMLNKDQQSFYVGVRSAAYKMAWLFGSGFMVYIAGQLEQQYGLYVGWSVAYAIMAVVLAATTLFHGIYLPHKQRVAIERDCEIVTQAHAGVGATSSTGIASVERGGGAAMLPPAPPADVTDATFADDLTKRKLTPGEFYRAISSYFHQPGAPAIVFYILLFRLGDALMLKQAPLFLQDPLTKGGMALTIKDMGILYGTVGMVALLIGGIIGGWLMSRHGLRRWFWPLTLFQNSAIILYYLLATYKPSTVWIYAANSIEQFAYGLGVSAYMVFLLRTIRTEYKAAHYAVATGLMTLGMLIPGMLSGYLLQFSRLRKFLLD